MPSSHLLNLVLLLASLHPTSPYSHGAPPSQCSNLTPGHNTDPQKSESPYTITVSKSELQPGESTTVKITSPASSHFNGFIAIAQPSSANGKYGETSSSYGEFKTQDDKSQLLRCHKRIGSGVTHKSGEKKSEVQFEWVAPAVGGEYVVLVSIVRDYSTFWIRQPSPLIRVKGGDAAAVPQGEQQLPPSQKAPSPAAASKSAEYYEGCGSTKGCFGLPSGCISSQSCELFTTFQKRGSDHVFQIGGRLEDGQGYIAQGLSFDDKMSDSSIVACLLNSNGQVRLYSFYSRGHTLQGAEPAFTSPSSKYEDGFLLCEYVRNPQVSIENGKDFNLEEDEYHLLLATGPAGSPEPLDYHSNRLSSRSTTRLDDYQILDEGEEDKLKAEFYGGCGTSKSCFGVPTGCWRTRDCLMLVTYNEIFELQLMGSIPDANEQGYIAVGLSRDGQMAPASTTACVLHPAQTEIRARAYYNYADTLSRYSVPMANASSGLDSFESGTYMNGNLYCTFQRTPSLIIEELDEEFDLENIQYHLLLARSRIGAPELLGQHEPSALHRSSTPNPVSLTSEEYYTFDPPTPTLEELLDHYYSGCETDYGCFVLPKKNCVKDKSCEMLGAFNQELEFKLMGKTQGYVALGLSFDDKMGTDLVTGCYALQGAPRVSSFYNVQDGKLNQGFTNDPNKGIVQGSATATVIDGWMFCEYKRHPMIDSQELGRVFNLEQDEYHFLLSRGDAADVGYLSKHPSPSDRASTPSAEHLSYIGILGPKSDILIELHASFMIFAWLLCASTGMFTARYYKQTHTSINPLNKAFWFVVHLSCMATTVLLTICGGIFIFIQIGGYSKGLEGAAKWHPVLGLILEGLAVCQVLIALFRPHPGTARRPLFNWVHWSIGNVAHIVGIACLFLAESLSKSGIHGDKPYLYVLVGFVIFHVAMHVVMSIHTVWADKKLEVNSRNRMRAVRPGPMKPSGKSEEAPGTSLRTALLSLYVLVACGVAITLVVLVTRKL